MITVCGEALVDLVPTDPGALAPLVPALGGGPFNVAITAARQGAPTRLLSRISTDAFGEQLVHTLTRENVDLSLLQRGDEPTSLAVTSLAADGSASYTFYLEGTADRLVDPQEDVTTDIACFGTCSLALEPGASRYAALLRRLSAAGSFIALDPNIRPFYATDQHATFLRSLLPDVDLLKLSDEEDVFLGGPTARIKVITRGGDGLELITGDTSIRVLPPPVEVADTIGAGDTVMGCLIAHIHHIASSRGLPAREATKTMSEEDWAQVAQYAADAAALTCTRTGAQPPFRAEVTALRGS